MASATSSQPLFEYSVVPFLRTLKNLIHIMDKAEAHAKENGENVEDYVKLQICADMKNFGAQIQALSDTAKSPVSRIAGYDASRTTFPDTEQTWSDFRARVVKTGALLEAATPDDFAGKEHVEISISGGRFKADAVTFLQIYAIPNFYFHVVTAYNLLRMKGVPIGKFDFLAGESGFPS